MNAKMEDLEVNDKQQQKSIKQKSSIPAKDKKLHLQFIQENVSAIVITIGLDFSCQGQNLVKQVESMDSSSK